VLRLDDPVARWLPELAPAPDGIGSITLRQLATHTAGLPRLPTTLGFFLQMLRDPADPYARYTRDDLLADLTKMAPTTPGTFAYSNLGYAVLGLVLERASGRSYAHFSPTSCCSLQASWTRRWNRLIRAWPPAIAAMASPPRIGIWGLLQPPVR
jgi:hypothetical protein